MLGLFFLIGAGYMTAQQIPSTNIPEAEPYEEGEFPEWAEKLYRFQVITIGSLPITMFVSELGYSSYLAFQNDSRAFSGASFLTSSEQTLIIGSAAGISLGLGLIDFLLGLGGD